MITICIPISESKSYCFHDFARGVCELDHPKERLCVIFALDDFSANEVEKKIEKFIEFWPYPENCYIVTTTISANNPNCSDIIPWQTRARFAAELRSLYTKFVLEMLPNTDYIFSVGSDIILESDSLDQLLAVDKKITSGLYISRIQRKPLALSYADGKWSYDEVDLDSIQPFKADWSGLDCALIHRDVFSEVNWENFSVDMYDIGEDGYFYLEAKEKGYQLWINPLVKPLHAQEDGSIVAARSVSSIGLIVTCDSCGWSTKLEKKWKDVTIQCPKCKTLFWMDPFWKPRELDITAIGAGIPISMI